ncbi:MAG: MFS transporter [Acidimicrobiia bacterium]
MADTSAAPEGAMAISAEDPSAAERTRLVTEVDRLRARFPKYPKRYLYILMAVGAVDAADRTILATVIEDIRRAFDVSDSQIGWLIGAYGVVAALSVLPFGWLADRWNRVWLIALGFIPWSIAMFWAGAAQSFTMMFAARMFLGSIEATNGPSTPSLLGDYYPVKERGRVFGIYGIGALIGTLMGFALAGVLATIFDWRTAFFVWGAMGIVCGIAVWRLLPEPPRGIPDALDGAEAALATHDATTVTPATEATTQLDEPVSTDRDCDYRHLSLWEATREIARVRTMWITFVAGFAGEFFFSAIASWAPTFFRRYHGFSAAGAGSLVALLALSVVGGIVVGGRFSDRQLAAGHPARRIRMAGFADIAAVFTLLISFGFDSLPVIVPLFIASGFLIGIPMAPLSAVGLDIMVPHLRGRAAAIRSVLRVSAVAVAPILFGYLSDQYGLRTALLAIAPMLGVGGLITLLAIRTYPRDMAYAQSESLRQQQLEDELGHELADPDILHSGAHSVMVEEIARD